MICTGCDQDKPIDEFPWKNKARGRRASRCKPCKRRDSTAWYYRNREQHIKRVTADQVIRRQRVRELVRSLKEAPCLDRGFSWPWYVMDFDHVGEAKLLNVADMINQGYGREANLREVAKCEPVCANCHRIRTYNRRHARR
jgi:hypothetical protein